MGSLPAVKHKHADSNTQTVIQLCTKAQMKAAIRSNKSLDYEKLEHKINAGYCLFTHGQC